MSGTTTATGPRFGVNYVPGTGWWYCWQDWDADAIRRDLRAIAGLGCDHIRIHCLWSLFQPNAALVSASMLDRTVELLRLAGAEGLDVVVTVLDGWLSGFDFRPHWLQDASVFADEGAVRAELLLIEAIADRVRDEPNFLGFDVSNEPSVLLDFAENTATSEQADRWVETMLVHCERVAPGGLHSVGMDHRPWMTDLPFGRDTMGTTGTLTPIHAWTFFTGALERYGPTGTGALHLAEFMLEVAKAHHTRPDRQVWLQEYGVAPAWMAPDEALDYVARATRAACEVEGLWGVTWWCSHDVDRGLAGFADLEYDLGLLTTDNTVKPTGERFRRIVEEARATAPSVPHREVGLVLPEGTVPDLDFGDHFFRLVDEGVRPAVVLERSAADTAYLAGRGMTRLVDPRSG